MPPTTLFHELENRAGTDVIVIPHHLPINKWWNFPEVEAFEMGGPLPALARSEVDAIQPVAEVFSGLHGMNECMRKKDWIKPPTLWTWAMLDTFWQDGLKAGVRAGAVCGSDNHRSALGHPILNAKTAVYAKNLTREGIFRAIQERRTYGTSGPRLFLHVAMGDARMGDIVTLENQEPVPEMEVNVVSAVTIDHIEIIRVSPGRADPVHDHLVQGARETAFSWLETVKPAYSWVCYYLRVHLDGDTHGAWTSPIWFEFGHKPDMPLGTE
jgi:hypothetical protein